MHFIEEVCADNYKARKDESKAGGNRNQGKKIQQRRQKKDRIETRLTDN